jgi:serine/threonine-protein kinase
MTDETSSQPAEGDLTGTVLHDRYMILRQLGEGGMGTVYLAEHTTIRKKFAVKVLSGEFAHKKDLVDRFLQEARAASMIAQQNVVEISDFGDTPDGSVFFVMEHLDGEDLSGTVEREGALPWSRVRGIMLQVCDALSAAHDAGIYHRDMKPENCFRITRGGNEDFIKVLDFGIAKVTDDEGEGKGLTKTGMIFGTPEYMSPEQAQGKKVDHRVDVYAAGVIMYELLTGRVPFLGDTFMAILSKHMFEVPEAPSAVNPEAEITAEMEAVILKAMQKDRDLRFADMREMKEAIAAVGSGAAAVQVVQENIHRPEAGQMSFVPNPNAGTHPPAPGHAAQGATYPPPGGGTYPGGGTQPPQPAGTYPPGAGTYPPGMYAAPQRRSPATVVAAGLAFLGLAGGGAFVAVSSGPDAPVATAPAANVQPAPAATPEPAPAPKVEAPAPTPAPKVVDEAAATITLKVETKVPAQILDASDGALLGMTNDPKGFAIEKSGTAVKLAIVADGYERLEFETVPSRDKELVKDLVKKAAARPRGGKRGGSKGGSKTADPGPTPATAPKKPTPKPDAVVSDELSNPFG